MKQIFTVLLILMGQQTLLAQEIKVPTHVCSISFYCECEIRDSTGYRRWASPEDSTRAIYHYMHSRPINNNSSNYEPPESKSYYHLKNGSFYLED